MVDSVVSVSCMICARLSIVDYLPNMANQQTKITWVFYVFLVAAW
jgi:hypothetical protein